MPGPGRGITSRAKRISCDEGMDGTYDCEVFEEGMGPPVDDFHGITGVQVLEDDDVDGEIVYAHSYTDEKTPEGPDLQYRFKGNVEVRWIHEENTTSGPMLLVDT